ncbi:MAG: hypothetical protein R2912_11870, partial [Eubacteriales bacterium]
ILCLCACGPRRPADTVRVYMAAANRGDLETMLNCIEPDAANLIRGITDIAGSQFGIDGGTMIRMSPGLMSIANAYGAGYGVEYTITDEAVNGRYAIVTVDYTMKSGGVEQTEEDVKIPLVLLDGRWYLALS